MVNIGYFRHTNLSILVGGGIHCGLIDLFFHFDVLIHLLKENEIFLLGVSLFALPSNIFLVDLQYFVHLVCVLSPFAADQTVLSPRISRHKICLGHKLIDFDFSRALSFLMKMSFRRATPSSPKKLETKAYFPKISPIW